MKFNCASCGKALQPNERAYIDMPIPPRGMTEIQAYLKLNGAKIYCHDCIQLRSGKPKKA